VRRTRVERGIYRQANGTYGVYVMAGGKPRFQTVGTKLAGARRSRDRLSAKAERGELAPPSKMTFAELAETWIEGFAAQVEGGERSERTLENYRYHLERHLLPALGRRRLTEISTDDCARLVVSLRAQGLAAKTIAGALVPQPPLRLHDLRHTFASHLIVDLKLDVAHVSRILGHARPSITLDTYTHLFDQAAHAANIRQLMAESSFGHLLADVGERDSRKGANPSIGG
jgi:hypothetical protein